jgi:hypothetical protein
MPLDWWNPEDFKREFPTDEAKRLHAIPEFRIPRAESDWFTKKGEELMSPAELTRRYWRLFREYDYPLTLADTKKYGYPLVDSDDEFSLSELTESVADSDEDFVVHDSGSGEPAFDEDGDEGESEYWDDEFGSEEEVMSEDEARKRKGDSLDQEGAVPSKKKRTVYMEHRKREEDDDDAEDGRHRRVKERRVQDEDAEVPDPQPLAKSSSPQILGSPNDASDEMEYSTSDETVSYHPGTGNHFYTSSPHIAGPPRDTSDQSEYSALDETMSYHPATENEIYTPQNAGEWSAEGSAEPTFQTYEATDQYAHATPSNGISDHAAGGGGAAGADNGANDGYVQESGAVQPVNTEVRWYQNGDGGPWCYETFDGRHFYQTPGGDWFEFQPGGGYIQTQSDGHDHYAGGSAYVQGSGGYGSMQNANYGDSSYVRDNGGCGSMQSNAYIAANNVQGAYGYETNEWASLGTYNDVQDTSYRYETADQESMYMDDPANADDVQGTSSGYETAEDEGGFEVDDEMGSDEEY